MRCISLFIILFCTQNLLAQQSYFKNINIPVYQNGAPIDLAWAGGIDKGAMFELDLNNDGVDDLFIFEKNNAGQPGRVTTLINNNVPNTISYEYAPQYAKNFPEMKDWAVLFDYNCDGKKDLMTWVSQGARVFKNVSQPNQSIQFQLEYPYIVADGTANAYVARTDHPCVADFDNDGDADMISVYILGSYYIYYKNLAKELFNRCDTLIMETQNNCFGQLYLGSVNNTATLGVSCRMANPDLVSQAEQEMKIDTGAIRDGGNCTYAFDYNHDGNFDLYVGDKLASSLMKLQNGGGNVMVSQDTLYPSYDVSVEMFEFPASYFIDVDNDTKKDMIISSCDKTDAGENYFGVQYYKNIGTSMLDSFNFQSNNFLVDKMIDVGSGAAPRFFDADADGLLDIIVGNKGVFQISPDSTFESGLAWYKNTGTATQPQFDLQTIDYAGLFQYTTWNDIKPTFGDLDGDGDKDMVVGIDNGSLNYFENNAPPGQAANFNLTGPNYFSMDVGKRAAPFIYDLNKDGLLDIVAGNQLGQVYYYENAGTASSPAFGTPVMGIGNINVVPPFSIQANATPFFFDDNGVTKMLVGNEYGYVYYFNNIDGNLGGTFTLVDSSYNHIYEPIRACLDGGDINGDGFMDIIVGNQAGGLAIYQYSASAINENGSYENMFTLYPNPAENYFVIHTNIAAKQMQLFSIEGKLIMEQKLHENYTIIKTETLQKGLYFCRVTDTRGNNSMKKIIVK